MSYGVYDFQNKIESLSCLIRDVLWMERELDNKEKEIEDEANRLLDQERDRIEKEGIRENIASYIIRLEQQGSSLVNNAQGTIRYFEQTYKVMYRPQNIDYVSNIYYSSPEDYINYMRSLSGSISADVMKLTNTFGGSILGRFIRPDTSEDVHRIFQNYETLWQMGAVLHDRLDDYYDKELEKQMQGMENIKREADRQIDEIGATVSHAVKQKKESIEECLRHFFYDDYISEVERMYNAPEKLDVSLGIYNFYVGGLNEKGTVYQLLQQRFKKFLYDENVRIKVGFNLSEQHSFIFNLDSEKSKYRAVAIGENMILQQLAKIEPDQMKITICSCKGMLDGLENLATICKNFPEIAKGVFIRDEDVKDSILDHVDSMDDILQNKLSDYKSVEEFNLGNIKKIPYRILFIVDYGFDYLKNELKSLIEQGYKAGIQVILITNIPYKTATEDNAYTGIFKNKMAFQEMEDELTWRNISIPRLDLVPKTNTIDFNSFYSDFAVAYMETMNKIVKFENLINSNEKYGRNTKEKLSIPVGINENGNIQCIEMGDTVANGTSHYGIIVGPTGSGKSSLLHTIITSSIMNYSPDELELYLLDFKQGNEFKIYENKKIPQIKCLGLDAMQEFGDSVLQSLWGELERRNKLFTEASQNGVDIKDITAYRKAGYQLPRILVIMDEFQVLFDTTRNKNVAYKAAARMSDFVSRARVYGIHFLLATQTLHKIYETSSLSRGTLEEMHIRIGLQCQENELSRLMGDNNVKKCIRKETKKRGSGIYLENDIVSEPVSMQVAYLESETQKQILADVERDFENVQFDEANISYTFRGDDTPILKKSDLEKLAHENMGFVIGEPIGLGEPIAIRINKRRKSDVLIVGENQNMLCHMTQIWIRQILNSIHNVNNKRLYIFDGAMMIDEPSLIGDCVDEEQAEKIVLVDNIFTVLKTIDAIYEEYIARRQRTMNSERISSDMENIYVVVSNYQWIEPLVRIMEHQDVSEFEELNQLDDTGEGMKIVNLEDPFSSVNDMMAELREGLDTINKKTMGTAKQSKNISYYKKMKNMLSSGYFCGLHFLFTCQDVSLIKKLGQSELAVFKNRVLFKSSSRDSYAIIDTSINTERLSENMAIYSDGVNDPQLFRPYLWSDE